jgi:CRP-like cAMP-binding protein
MTAPLTLQNPLLNHLLAELPSDVYKRLLPGLECVSLPLGEEIYAAGQTLKYVYFPSTAIISLLYTMEDGRSAEIGVVGNDGILGIAVFMGGESVPNKAVVQSEGFCCAC